MSNQFEEQAPGERPGADAPQPRAGQQGAAGGDAGEHEQVVPVEGADAAGADPADPGFDIPDDASALLDAQTGGQAPVEEVPAATSEVAQLRALVDERTVDLQRLHAEYVNYKRRVDRDRDVARARGVESVVLDLLPILDSVQAAREHGELTGGVTLIVDELEKLIAKYGLEVYGEVGEPFDPNVHEALMQVPYEGPHDVTVVSAVMQKGVRLHDRVLRPARVGVAEPA